MNKALKPEDIILEEEFILTTLRVENNACEGCKEKAIQYHVAIVELMTELLRLRGEIKQSISHKSLFDIIKEERRSLFEYCYKEHIAIDDDEEDEAVFIKGRMFELSVLQGKITRKKVFNK